jgi:acetyltransferase
MRSHPLQHLFEPRSLVLVCENLEPGSAAARVRSQLDVGGFGGDISVICSAPPIGAPEVYTSFAQMGRGSDLAVMVLPSTSVPAQLRACAEAGCSAVILLAPDGGEQEERPAEFITDIRDLARRYGLTVLGPDSLGLARPSAGLNATLSHSQLGAGQVALIAESAGFSSALMDWAGSNRFGFSLVASPGASAAVTIGDLLDYLSLDAQTRSVLVYLERVVDARSFLSGLRALARVKPVIVLKSGRGSASCAREAAADRVFDAAIARAGAVRVNTVHQLFTAARALMAGTRVRGPGLGIVTNAAGPARMASDRAARRGVLLPQPGSLMLEGITNTAPAARLAGSAIDLLGDAGPSDYKAAVSALVADPEFDAVLVLFTPQHKSDALGCARAVIEATRGVKKPVIACWMGQSRVAEARETLQESGILQFASPERCLDAFAYLAAYERHQAVLLQAPPSRGHQSPADVAGARRVIDEALGQQRQLTVVETTAVLGAFHIPVARLADDKGSRSLMLAIHCDPSFGPVIELAPMRGNAIGEAAVALPPLNLFLCSDLIRRSLSHLPGGVSNAAEEETLSDLLMRLSEICCVLPQIRGLVVRSRLAGDVALAVDDVHMQIAPPAASNRRYGHMAIHPYPDELRRCWRLPDGRDVVIRPIRPEDASLERAFVDRLSPDSRYNRFMYRMGKLSSKMLARFTQIDYDREMALVVVLTEGGQETRFLAVARYVTNPDGESCEFALAVADDVQRQGIGRKVMHSLFSAASDCGLEIMEGDVLASNAKMLRLCESLGFHLLRKSDDPEVIAVCRPLESTTDSVPARSP